MNARPATAAAAAALFAWGPYRSEAPVPAKDQRIIREARNASPPVSDPGSAQAAAKSDNPRGM
jgi:hypothetical protein